MSYAAGKSDGMRARTKGDTGGKSCKADPVAVADHLLSCAEPLDEADQAELIAAFEAMQLQGSNSWRRWFAAFTSILAVFYLYAAYYQYRHPWEVR